MFDTIPEITEKYEVIEELAQGGMGAVYRVRHRILDEIRVIKTIRPDRSTGEDSRDRFLREARVAAQLRHPNLAILYDCSITGDGTAYMVMEHIEGMDLRRFLKSGFSFSSDEAKALGLQVLDALEYIHGQKIIHRDISTDNLMLTEDSRGERMVKLIDLGLAKSLEQTDFKTQTGILVGKVKYIAPEQLSAGETLLDARCDLYSFGVVFYEILTGEIPVTGKDQMSLMAGHLYHPPKSFELTDPKGLVPAGLRTVILKALEKNPDDRYQSAREFRTALQGEAPATAAAPPPPRIQATEILADPPSPPSQSPLPESEQVAAVPTLARRITPGWKWSAAAVLVVVVALAGWQGFVRGARSASPSAAKTESTELAAAVPSYRKSYALIIGNNKYEFMDELKTAVGDARQVAALLENRYGFEVLLRENVTRDDLYEALYDLQEKVQARDSLLLYYAGHGQLYAGSEYWLPVDADDEFTNWLSTREEITKWIDEFPAKHVLVISDSCYAGAPEGGSTIEPSPQGDLVLRPSRLVLASGSFQPVLDKARGSTSIFAGSLIDALRENEGVLEVTQLFERLEREVARKAEELDAEQVPSLAPIPGTTDGGGGFFFIPKAQSPSL